MTAKLILAPEAGQDLAEAYAVLNENGEKDDNHLRRVSHLAGFFQEKVVSLVILSNPGR